MSDVDGATAPADTGAAPELPLNTPNPVELADQGHAEKDAKPEGKPEKVEAKEPTKPISTREALKNAREKVEAEAKTADKPKEVKTEIKTDAKAADKPDADKKDAPRGEHGHFAPKDGDKPKADAKPAEAAKPSHTAGEAPARFTLDAKAAWAALPENVRGEVSRMERELTQGYEKHKTNSEAYEAYRELDDIAKQHGKRGADVFRDYYQMEQHLRKDIVGGLEQICQKAGVSLKEVAAHVMGQTPDQNATAQDATIRELKAEIADLKGAVGNVTQTFQQQRENAVLQDVTKFAADNPRFEELHKDIAFFMQTGRATDLSEAYKLAERLNPAPAQATDTTAASSAPVIDLSAQTEKGQKSIQGSPTPGSDPVSRRPPSTSIKESLRRAMAASA